MIKWTSETYGLKCLTSGTSGEIYCSEFLVGWSRIRLEHWELSCLSLYLVKKSVQSSAMALCWWSWAEIWRTLDEPTILILPALIDYPFSISKYQSYIRTTSRASTSPNQVLQAIHLFMDIEQTLAATPIRSKLSVVSFPCLTIKASSQVQMASPGFIISIKNRDPLAFPSGVSTINFFLSFFFVL